MDRWGGLFANRLYDPRMSVAQSVYTEVRLLSRGSDSPPGRIRPPPLLVFEGDGIAVIKRARGQLFSRLDDFFGVGHQENI